MATLAAEAIDQHLEINENFARSRGLTDDDILELKATYLQMANVLEYPQMYDDPVARVKELEFQMQRQWGFPEDAKFHYYGLYIRGCTCPRIDNRELVGHTELRYAASDCPWHWKEPKNG